jgi:hypothetical protein
VVQLKPRGSLKAYGLTAAASVLVLLFIVLSTWAMATRQQRSPPGFPSDWACERYGKASATICMKQVDAAR